MRHLKRTAKLGRTSEHRNAMLANMVCSLIKKRRIKTTLAKAKAARSVVEKMITLGKNGSVHARRQALAYLMTPESVDRLFAVVAPRYESRPGGYSRIIRTGVRKGDSSEMAYIELLGAEQELSEKASKREEVRSKRREELQKQLEEANAGAEGDKPAE